MIPTDRFFPSHRLHISGYAGIEYPLHILQSLSPLSRLTQLASPSLSPARRFRIVRVPWTLLCTITAVKTTVGWFTISGPSSWQSAPLSPPSTSRIRALLPHPLRLRESGTNCLYHRRCTTSPLVWMEHLTSLTCCCVHAYAHAPLPRLHRHVRHECVPPAARTALLLNNTINAEGITSSQMFLFALYLLCTPRCCRVRAYTTPSALALAFAAQRLVPQTLHSCSTRGMRRADLPWERPAMVPSPSSDWMGCKSVALMEWEEGVQWRGRWASLIVGPMLAHSSSHDLTVCRQAIFDPIFARFRYIRCLQRFAR
ncbi:hypothetical protein B0H13DRAFT_2337569 [Mycena leptocephala]|nr:hypothetical protein B0H13DRAFT_2337569 [Mycena leptocephala]